MRYFTSDHHFYHKNIIDFCSRPWNNVEDMNRGLILRWNKRIKPDDEVYILGDMFFCGSVLSKEILAQLNGKKTLISGNHDWDKLKPHRAEEFGLTIIEGNTKMMIGEREVNVSHFPYKNQGDHTDYPRYNEHRIEDDGNWLIHGHVHHIWKQKDKMINVGVDVWDWFPVPEEDLIKMMEEHEKGD